MREVTKLVEHRQLGRYPMGQRKGGARGILDKTILGAELLPASSASLGPAHYASVGSSSHPSTQSLLTTGCISKLSTEGCTHTSGK